MSDERVSARMAEEAWAGQPIGLCWVLASLRMTLLNTLLRKTQLFRNTRRCTCNDISKILILVRSQCDGQSAEFDYSGRSVQALRRRFEVVW